MVCKAGLTDHELVKDDGHPLAEAAEAAAGDTEGSASHAVPISNNTAAWDMLESDIGK
jgi:hypothetical protein